MKRAYEKIIETTSWILGGVSLERYGVLKRGRFCGNSDPLYLLRLSYRDSAADIKLTTRSYSEIVHGSGLQGATHACWRSRYSLFPVGFSMKADSHLHSPQGKVLSLKLLVVNENNEFSDLIADYAETHGVSDAGEVRVVHTGAEALSTFGSWVPSAVIVDAHLHDMNALELVAQLTSEATSIIVTSDTYSKDIETTSAKYGAAGYIVMSKDHEVLEKLFGLLSSFEHQRSRDVH